MSDLIRLSGATVNAPDAIALARFYAEITGGIAKGDEYWALAEGPNGDIGFQQIEDYRPPTWPDGEVGMQMHLEFFVDDRHILGLDCAEVRVLGVRVASIERTRLAPTSRPARMPWPEKTSLSDVRALIRPCTRSSSAR